MVSQPQFLLFCDTHTSQPASAIPGQPLDSSSHDGQPTGDQLPRCRTLSGRWHFVLDRLDSPQRLEATDAESAIHPDRLALLSVVRGLEALDEPSQVNLVTTSRYVSRGLKYGLATWRASDYRWEHFGIQRPVRNADLWQRVDRAMRYHGVTCRLLQASQSVSDRSADPAHMVVDRSVDPVPHAAAHSADPTSNLLNRSVAPTPSHQTTIQTPDRRLVTVSEHALHLNTALSRWCSMLVSWWEMALTWLKWRRRRNQTRPAVFGV